MAKLLGKSDWKVGHACGYALWVLTLWLSSDLRQKLFDLRQHTYTAHKHNRGL